LRGSEAHHAHFEPIKRDDRSCGCGRQIAAGDQENLIGGIVGGVQDHGSGQLTAAALLGEQRLRQGTEHGCREEHQAVSHDGLPHECEASAQYSTASVREELPVTSETLFGFW
jgi:hypothetical protein